MNKPLLLLFALVGLLLTGCSPTALAVNDDIDKELRKTFEPLNQSLVNALWKNTSRGYRRLGTERFGKKEDTPLMELVSEIYFNPQMPHTFEVVDEFYREDGGSGPVVVNSGKHGYSVSFHNNKPEYYVSVLQIQPNEQQHYLVAAVYNLEDEEWALDNVFPVRYAMLGKTASDMLAMAKNWENRGFMIDAYVHAHGARNLVEHSGDHIIYKEKKEILKYRDQLARKIEAEYGKYPLRIGAISSSPQIFDFDMAFHEKGLYPAIHYISNVPGSDYEAQVQEAKDIKEYMTKHMPDLAQNQGYVFYRRFTMDPEVDTEPYFSNAFIDYNNNFGK